MIENKNNANMQHPTMQGFGGKFETFVLFRNFCAKLKRKCYKSLHCG